MQSALSARPQLLSGNWSQGLTVLRKKQKDMKIGPHLPKLFQNSNDSCYET